MDHLKQLINWAIFNSRYGYPTDKNGKFEWVQWMRAAFKKEDDSITIEEKERKTEGKERNKDHLLVMEGIALGLMGNIFVSNGGMLIHAIDFHKGGFFLVAMLILAFFYLLVGIRSCLWLLTNFDRIHYVVQGKKDWDSIDVTKKNRDYDWIIEECDRNICGKINSAVIGMLLGMLFFLDFAVWVEKFRSPLGIINEEKYFLGFLTVTLYFLSSRKIKEGWGIPINKLKLDVNKNGAKMKTRNVIVSVVLLFILFIGFVIYSTHDNLSSMVPTDSPEISNVRVGYLEITPNLPFFTAIEKELFTQKGLNIEAIPFKTSNELVESLVTNRIDFTTVTALSVLQSLEVASPGRLKIYQINYIPKVDPNDFLLIKKDSPIEKIDDLKGKKIALFPGSNFEVWAKLIFGEHFGFGDQLITVQLPPPNHIEALAAGSVDASYCLEPTATIGLSKGVARILDLGLVSKYIFDPFPVTGSAVLTEFAEKNPSTTQKFCDVMADASLLVANNPDLYRSYLVKYCKIPESIAKLVKLGHDTKSQEVEVAGLQRTVEIYMKEGILKQTIDMQNMLLYPPPGQYLAK